MAGLLFRLMLGAAALAFAYGLISSAGGGGVTPREATSAGGVRSAWAVDWRGEKHGEERIYDTDGRLSTRLLWDRGQWVESCSYRPNGRLYVRCADTFPWGVMRCDEFDESGRLVRTASW